METEFEAIQLTFGGLVFVIGLASVVAVSVWTIFKIRASDKESLEHGYTNAVNRVDSKYANDVNLLHQRVNRLMEKDADVQRDIGYLMGKIDD